MYELTGVDGPEDDEHVEIDEGPSESLDRLGGDESIGTDSLALAKRLRTENLRLLENVLVDGVGDAERSKPRAFWLSSFGMVGSSL